MFKGKRIALGQHFLKDKGIAQTIVQKFVEEVKKNRSQSSLEIGPGKGALTFPLLKLLENENIKRIFCEKDYEFSATWKNLFAISPAPIRENTLLIEGDFLDLKEESWLIASPLSILSNLPYSVGTAILSKLAKQPRKIPVMVLMLQAEVAQRLYASPRTKSWGSLSLWIQNRWDVEKLISVPPQAFVPPPKVFSEVVILRARAQARVIIPDTQEAEALWEKLLKIAFQHRRKMLRAGFPKEGPWRNVLETSGVDATSRAEALDWNDWDQLFRAALQFL